MPKKQYLEAGQIVGTHGIRGEVRVQPWCDSAEVLSSLTTLYYDEGQTPVTVSTRPHKNIALMKIDGVDTVQDAAVLRGRILYLNRSDLKLAEGTYFVQDLIGLQVMDADSGEEYGALADVSPTGANDVYHIRTADGEVLIPAVPSVIIETDVDSGLMKIRPIKGMFDHEI
ncbi:MAG TPA: 16S rRNA processing protein RimM [Ruminococcaceae bacterium]|nr:16S rRNA processing protein RimM [Oscillospiraceae bacterium]HCA29346.1 16S rRNA processing protein RimM [Oscillospiraceae bacterium]